ncbi:hypothetical protein ACU1JV_00815 [Paenibacillus sp. T2-29]|uniref:hypothetical protein n=1 Tax=Paenibacillus TaxID=44249 RepID=UPI0039BD4CBF
MFDWSFLLTSTVVSAIITTVVGNSLKHRFDKKLEENKVTFERERLDLTHQMHKELEVLKSNIGHLSILNQKNIEHFQTLNQVIQTNRIEALKIVWSEYLGIRIGMSPVLNFFSIFLPEEYLNIIDKINESDRLGLRTISDSESNLLNGIDTVPILRMLEEQRPFLGELMYYKFRSSIVIQFRLKLMYLKMVKKRELYNWCEDILIMEHLKVVFSLDTISEGQIPINLDSPLKLLSVTGLVEFELNKTMDSVLSGEISANISLERAKKLSNGYTMN